MQEEKREVELPTSYAVVEIPDDTVELTLTAKILANGDLLPVQRIMTTKEVWKAFKEAEDGYIPSDAVFQITEEGRRWLEEQEANRTP